jgi:serine/threonine-protein kinase
VTVHLSASPTNARLYLDDTALETNPYSKALAADPAPHKVRAEAPGFTPETAIITFAHNTDVRFTLERAQPAHGAPSAHPPRPAASGIEKDSGTSAESESKSPSHAGRAESVAPEVVAKPDCDPPYVIEESGIRRLKPECL